jgi:L-alanine-DL-glutamate epimerase-like enolase superfamily enzyme
MRIKSAEVRRIEVPYGPDGFKPSWLPGVRQDTYSQTVVRLFSDTGLVGFASTNCFENEVYEFTRDVLPLLLARKLNQPEDLERAWDSIREAVGEKDRSTMLRTVLNGALNPSPNRTVSWIKVLRNLSVSPTKIPYLFDKNIPLNHSPWYLNVALWDLLAKSQDKSVADCLGKERDAVPAYASTGELVSGSTQKFVRKCRKTGYSGIKLRIKDPDPAGEQLNHVKGVAESTPDDFQVGVDANEGWSLLPPYWTYEEALTVGKQLYRWDVDWLEEPFGCLRNDQLQGLTDDLNIETVGGELEAGPDRQRELFSAYDTINPDICMTIGFSEGIELARDAWGAETGFTPHTWGLGPSLAAGLQLSCAVPEIERIEVPHDPAWSPAYRDAILEDPLSVEDGELKLPGSPGLGVSLDLASLEEYTTRKHRLGPSLA